MALQAALLHSSFIQSGKLVSHRQPESDSTCTSVETASLASNSRRIHSFGTPGANSSPLSRRLLLQAGHTNLASRPLGLQTPKSALSDSQIRDELKDQNATQKDESRVRILPGRRDLLVVGAALSTWQLLSASLSYPVLARERRQKTDFPEESYYDAGNGLKYLDIDAGSGREAEPGEEVSVHFEVRFGPLTVVSTRESKLLGGNRSISQPYEFTLGAPPYSERRRKDSENANGLFSAQAAPRPPRALYAAVSGMKVGGKRAVLVPADLGYGSKGYNEIPPDARIQMIVDLLEVSKPE